MKHLRALLYCAALMLVAAVSGCFPGGDNHVDEEKEPHFQRGRNLASSQDFTGAVEEFEHALEANPRSAAAHFELGWLYDTKINDPAAAIYHYQRHLSFQPDSERTQLVKERIRGCRQQLANTEFPLPNSQNLQREVDRLTAENLLLRQQMETLRSQETANAAAAQASRAAVARYASAPVPAQQGQVQSGGRVLASSAASATSPAAAPDRASTARSQPQGNLAASAPSPRHVHVIRERETIISIAAHYGIKPNALIAANPKIEPRRLRVGQSLNVP